MVYGVEAAVALDAQTDADAAQRLKLSFMSWTIGDRFGGGSSRSFAAGPSTLRSEHARHWTDDAVSSN